MPGQEERAGWRGLGRRRGWSSPCYLLLTMTSSSTSSLGSCSRSRGSLTVMVPVVTLITKGTLASRTRGQQEPVAATGKGRPGPLSASRSGWQSLGAQNQFPGSPLLPDHPSCSFHRAIPCLSHSAPSLTGDVVEDFIIHPCVSVHGSDSQHSGALWGHGHQSRTYDISNCPQAWWPRHFRASELPGRAGDRDMTLGQAGS